MHDVQAQLENRFAPMNVFYGGMRRTGIYQVDPYWVYRHDADQVVAPPTAQVGALRFFGIHRLVETGDATRLRLPARYEAMADAGNSGLVAERDGRVVGWVWCRPGPFEEEAGCGRIALPWGFEVIRYFEVDESVRGRGFGKTILRELTERLRRRSPGPLMRSSVPPTGPRRSLSKTSGISGSRW